MIAKFIKLFRVLTSGKIIWYRALIKHGVAPSIEHLSVLRSLDVDLFIDVGANRGQFCLAATSVRPDAKIICFEPLSAPFAVLSQLFATNANVSAHQVAIGNVEACETMNVSGRDDSSSLLDIAPLQSEIFPGTERNGSEDVLVRRLSSFVSEIEFPSKVLLKIDVQGFELEVLEGASDALAEVTYVYVECSFVELYEARLLRVILWTF